MAKAANPDVLIVRHGLREFPEVVRAADLLRADRDLVAGKCLHLWGHVARHGDDGLLGGADRAFVDSLVGLPGFAEALASVGWLDFDLTGCQVLGWEKYLGVEAVRRSVEAWLKLHPRRVGKARSPDDPDFDDFWAEYPLKKARLEALKVWRKISPDEATRVKIMAALREEKKSHQWTKERGKYVPHATTWLNGERWKDERGQSPAAPEAATPGRVAAPAGKYAHLSQAPSLGSTTPSVAAPQGQEGGLDRPDGQGNLPGFGEG